MRNWLDSATVRHLVAAFLLNLLGWAMLSLNSDVWDWKQLVATTIAILIPFIRRIAQPDLDAPVSILNARNPQP